MGAAIIDGKAFAAGLRARVAATVPAFVAATGRKPGLAVVLVGADPASEVYVRNKSKATEAAGMASFAHRLPAETPQPTGRLVARSTATRRWTAFCPAALAEQIDEPRDRRIDPAKIGRVHPENVGKLAGPKGSCPARRWAA